ncbi:solute carrier family 2, facilitated glucose transporter member 3-like isoform X2 [Planococcus citri]|uniref:solute carrier family 2, facilitated glucose transporter member 3-like isoform X2 n=1 Tax=Planococcus citri TaxID=170843 RepID=UPI0031F98A9C
MDPERENINSLPIHSTTSITSRLSKPYRGDRWTPLLVLGAAVSTFGFAVPAGYCLGVLNTPAKEWCNETLIQERGIHLSHAKFHVMWSLIVSVFLIGGVIGGLTGAWFADRLGRKGTLISGNVLNVLSGILFFCSKYVPSIEMFFVCRIMVGFVAGLMTTVVPMYLTELSPPKYTGLMGVLFPVGLTFGILVSQVMGLDWLLGTEELWPFLISGYVLMTIFVFASLPWLPESPKYLYQVRKLEDEALKELSRLRDLPENIVRWEIFSNATSPRRATHENWNLIRVLSTPRLRIPLCLVIALQAGQQFSGINAIFYFSSNIFEAAGLSKDSIQYANIGTGVINFCITACSLLLVNSFGRRPLLIFSCALTSLTLILLTFSSKYMDLASWIPYLSVGIVLLFVFCYDLGLGPIPYFIGAELVDIGPRPVVMALGSVANWGGNFLIGVGYTTLHNWLNESIFLLFAASTLLLMTFITVYLPETKDISMSTNELAEHESMTEEP